MKKIFLIFLSVLFLDSYTTNAQHLAVEFTYSTPGAGFNTGQAAQDEAVDNFNHQVYADWAAKVAEYNRVVARFDRKLGLSASVVAQMNADSSKALKYPAVAAHYKRSFDNYKKLEPLSKTTSQYFKQQKPVQDLQNQEDAIIKQALNDYHEAEDLTELGEREDKILAEEAQNVMIQHNLQPAEKAELKQLTEKINLAKNQISKLNANAQHLSREARDLAKLQTYQLIAQQLVSEAKIVEKTIALINPDKTSTRAVALTQTMVEKFIEEYIENGKSPAGAISAAFDKGYQKFERDELLKAVTPIKDISRVPLLIEDVVKEIDKWNKIGDNQMAVLNKINEIQEFTNDGIRRQQQIVDRSLASSKIIIESAISRHLKKKTLM